MFVEGHRDTRQTKKMNGSLATSSATYKTQTAFQQGQNTTRLSFLGQDGHLTESFANFPRHF